MKQMKLIPKMSVSKLMMLFMFISILALVSCSQSICPVYVKYQSKDFHKQLLKSSRIGQCTPVPYSQKYISYLQKKNKGKKNSSGWMMP